MRRCSSLHHLVWIVIPWEHDMRLFAMSLKDVDRDRRVYRELFETQQRGGSFVVIDIIEGFSSLHSFTDDALKKRLIVRTHEM